MSVSVIGITATRKGLSPQQKQFLESYLMLSYVVHHGDCIGGDADADAIAKRHGIKRVAHPCNIPVQRAYCDCETVLQAKDPIERNHDIVIVCDTLLAFPSSRKEILRSGTWSTIRYARRIGCEICVVYPDGTFVIEEGRE